MGLADAISQQLCGEAPDLFTSCHATHPVLLVQAAQQAGPDPDAGSFGPFRSRVSLPAPRKHIGAIAPHAGAATAASAGLLTIAVATANATAMATGIII